MTVLSYCLENLSHIILNSPAYDPERLSACHPWQVFNYHPERPFTCHPERQRKTSYRSISSRVMEHILKGDGAGSLLVTILHDDRTIEMDSLLCARSLADRTTTRHNHGTCRNHHLAILVCADIFSCRGIEYGCGCIYYQLFTLGVILAVIALLILIGFSYTVPLEPSLVISATCTSFNPICLGVTDLFSAGILFNLLYIF